MKKTLVIVFLFINSIFTQQCFAEFKSVISQYEAERIARINAKIQEARILIGQSFYVYFPRKSCLEYYGIKDRPTIQPARLFSQSTPLRITVEQAVNGQDHLQGDVYLRLKTEDGETGYIELELAQKQMGDSSSTYSLKTSCWLKLNPAEVESRIQELEAERLAIENSKAEKVRLEKEGSRKLADLALQKKLAEQLERQKNFPVLLTKMSKWDFCIAYGNAARGEEVSDFGEIPNIVKLVKTEARRRKIVFSDALVRDMQIKIGMTECQLLAVWGAPRAQNQSTGVWGDHTQHVYNGAYVYTENGRVVSWQN